MRPGTKRVTPRCRADGKLLPVSQCRRAVNGVGSTPWGGGVHPGALRRTGGGQAMAGAAEAGGLPTGLGFDLGDAAQP